MSIKTTDTTLPAHLAGPPSITPEEYHRLKKPPKYRNKRVAVDGYAFDSLAEAKRYGQLRTLETGGAISDLRVKTRYPLVVNGQECGYYEDDFNYMDRGARIVEDVKGMRTDLYRLKRRLVKAIYGIDIVEIEPRAL
jgi:hypothetical protein